MGTSAIRTSAGPRRPGAKNTIKTGFAEIEIAWPFSSRGPAETIFYYKLVIFLPASALAAETSPLAAPRSDPVKTLRSSFNGNHCTRINADRQKREVMFTYVFIGRFPLALPPSIVVHNEHATRAKSRIQVKEFVASGLVPIRIEPEEADLVGSMTGNRVFDRSLNKVNPFCGITSRS